MMHLIILTTTLLITITVVSGNGCGICPGNSTVGSFPSASMSLDTNPFGNSFHTKTSLDIKGETTARFEREFLVSLGLFSSTGAEGKVTPYKDKVTLYTAIEASNGTGDVWAINPLVKQHPNSGSYNAQGIELDFNNNNVHRGEMDAGAGLASPTSYGLSISGAGQFRSTSGILLSGPGTHSIWNRGLVVANNCVMQSTIQDLGNPEISIDIRGNPKYGVYQASKQSRNYFAGPLYTNSTMEVNGDIIHSGRLLRVTKSGRKHDVYELYLTEKAKRKVLEQEVKILQSQMDAVLTKLNMLTLIDNQ
mmetsp:Transcript_5760/g.8893  ORF Transcript_5760/g.8893 Transcript_5760/m.8893 type:complete len:306 (-) Transcript_5760:7-924(-)